MRSSLNRRDFLRTGLAGSVLLGSSVTAARAAAPARATPARAGQARNVIFLVSDGMSMGTLAMAERHLRMHAGRGSHWIGLYDRPGVRRAIMDTASASSLVTDSAAASTAWGGGRRVNNGSINVAADGTVLTPILHHVREAGIGCGLVTTATITHATPAGFAVRVPARGEEGDIAAQYLDLGVDVLLGGGTQFFDAAKRKDGRDLFGDFAKAGYHVAHDAAGLAAAPLDGRLLGTFSSGQMPYSLDRASDPRLAEKTPTLADMARVALDRLSRHPHGFLLQIEGARIDHAAHANDVGGLLYDQLAFDEALGVALEFAGTRDDTLVIVTSDHGNANPGLNSTGGPNGNTETCFARLAQFRHTNTWMLEGLGAESRHGQIRERLEGATGIRFANEEIEIVARALRNEHREGYRVRNAPLVTLGQVMANHTSVGWTGTAHTTDFTELVAFGPGSERITPFVRNDAMFGVMAASLDLKKALA
jgi:alkaline phosphatase